MKRLFAVICIIFIITFNLYSTQEISPNLRKTNSTPFDNMWDIVFTFEASAESMPGIETDNINIYTTTWNANVFSRYDMNGTHLEDFTIAGVANVRDMAYDDTYFYGSAASMSIFIMDLANEILIGTIPVTCAGITGVRHIAFDPELDYGNGGFWIGNWNELGAITMNGTQIYANIYPNIQSLYGSAYDSWSDGGPYIWVFSQDGSGAEIHQFEIASLSFTGIMHDASDIPGVVGPPLAGGLATYITNNGIMAMLTNIQQSPNLIGVYEITFYPTVAVPDSPTNVTIIPNVSGVLEVECNWICPTTDVCGEPLIELLEMRVYRNDLLIYADTNPVIGGPGNYTDNSIPNNGFHEYRIVGYNSWGEGIPYIETVWVGEDVPGAVTNLTLTCIPQTLTAILNWTNPTSGLHGGAFNEPIMGYHIIRSDGCAFELTGIQTQYIDSTIPIPGYYSYTVQTYNSVGDGGIAEAGLWTWPQLLIYEDFSANFPPDGWSIEGGTNWQYSPTNNAGGIVPEAMFYWSPSTVATQRLISYPMDTSDMFSLYLEFTHYVDPYATFLLDISIQTTSDGINWNLAEQLDYYEDEIMLEELMINTPDVGSESFQIAWVFDGDSFNLDAWYVDDILLCEYYSGDTGIVEGMVTLSGGTGNIQEVDISSGSYSVNPDILGNYSMALPVGTQNISASLYSYDPVTIEDVVVEAGVTTSGIDFTLNYVELIPPSNLAVNEMGVFSWDVPFADEDRNKKTSKNQIRDLLGYNVFLDDCLCGFTEETEWIFEDLIIGQTYEAGVEAVYDAGNSEMVTIVFPPFTNSNDILNLNSTELSSIYPNPFNPSTTISFSVTEDLLNIEITIYNLKGQKVRQIISDQLSIGQYKILWNGKNDFGKNISSGIYFCKFKCGNVSQIKRIVMLK